MPKGIRGLMSSLAGASGGHRETDAPVQEIPVSELAAAMIDDIVTLRIPATWTRTKEGDATYFTVNAGSQGPVLRVTTAEYTSPENTLKDSTPIDALSGLAEDDGEPERLQNGNAMLRASRRGNDNGQQILMRVWIVAHPIPPNNIVIVFFKYIMRFEESGRSSNLAIIRMLDTEIPTCTFGR